MKKNIFDKKINRYIYLFNIFNFMIIKIILHIIFKLKNILIKNKKMDLKEIEITKINFLKLVQ